MLQSKQTLFYACYLLISQAPSKKNVVYIGSTPNPLRRLRQHNGEISGGAKKTVKSRPWEMAIVVYGFTSKFAALQFEWAWQNPHKSRHFKDKIFVGKQSERFLPSKLKALYLLLNLEHFQRWPLNLHFTVESIYQKFTILGSVNKHLKLTIGSLQTLEYDENEYKHHDIYESNSCAVCGENVDIEDLKGWLTCSETNCPMISHLRCLSNRFLENEKKLTGAEMLIPLNGTCPICDTDLKWGSLIKSMKSRLSGYQTVQKQSLENEMETSKQCIDQHLKTTEREQSLLTSLTECKRDLSQNNHYKRVELIVLDDSDEFSLAQSFKDLDLEFGN
ncbi:Slx4p interacting protein [Boothiomyces macroporosus]|uniref:Slx4p interacting protein n=1 Tax=Boothiomyces macroporosus TaxID=261099 RepID=A0AAD5UFT0_9FUNG|nr:Slx4p interacting protein [Boothiomyces macroporosus]